VKYELYIYILFRRNNVNGNDMAKVQKYRKGVGYDSGGRGSVEGTNSEPF
jgi:hypothetical protein